MAEVSAEQDSSMFSVHSPDEWLDRPVAARLSLVNPMRSFKLGFIVVFHRPNCMIGMTQ
jgi:hypothetical protein